MKYDAAAAFHADYARLTERDRAQFLRAVREINMAFAQRGGAWPLRWPTHLRIKRVQGLPGAWEMTWSFAGPDGRATFEFVTIDGDPAVKWRRIGDHRIFERP